jgi:membrane protein implicated in regulation of membrane protease activity
MNGMMRWQAIGALIAGAVASVAPPAIAMGTMAAASTVVTLLLVPGLCRSAPAAGHRPRSGRLMMTDHPNPS